MGGKKKYIEMFVLSRSHSNVILRLTMTINNW